MNIKSISAIGLLVVNLVMPTAVYAAPDVIVTYIPLDMPGQAYPTISEDGKYMAYKLARKVASGTPPYDIVIRDLVTGVDVQANIMVTGGIPTNALCDMPMLSGNGRYVSFGCRAREMGATTQNGTGYFVYDRINNKTELIPDLGADGAYAPYPTAISADGRFVVFITSNSSNGFKIFVRDMVSKTTVVTAINNTSPGEMPTRMSISADGRYISFLGRLKTNTTSDAFVHDRVTGTTETINVRPNGARSVAAVRQPSASDDASIIAFSSTDGDLVNPRGPATGSIYVRDRKTGVTELVSPRTTLTSWSSAVSGNGRYVVYMLDSSAHVYDRLTKATRKIVSPTVTGGLYPRMSADGRYVVFSGVEKPGPHTIVLADMGIAPGVTLSANELTLTEGGIAGTYTMALTQAPDADVKITVGPGNQLSVARTELVFTPENWSVPQVVSVQALSDGVAEGRHTATIVHTVASTDVNFTVVEPANVTVTITDGVTPTIVVPAATWNRSDMPLTGTAAPGATVLLTAVNRTTGWMSSVSTVADGQGKWSYTLTGFTDGVVELDAVADGIKSAVQTVTVKLVVAPPTPTYIDVTGYIRTTGLSMAYNRATGKYVGNVLLTNTGSIPLSGPLHLQFDNLTAGITLSNAIGSHNGSPYITVPGGLVPDGGVTIPLEFTNPAKNPINYDAKIYSGTF